MITSKDVRNKRFEKAAFGYKQEEIDEFLSQLEAELDEAALLKDVSHMPARVKCAQLAWRTLSEMLKNGDGTATTTE